MLEVKDNGNHEGRVKDKVVILYPKPYGKGKEKVAIF